MTREEAIYELKNAAWLGTDHSIARTEEAVEMAIQALSQEPTDTWSIKDVADTFTKHGLIREQEPCDDVISREYLKKIAQSEGAYGYVSAHDIATAPSVTQKPKTGHWIYDEIIENWRCSKCDETPKTMGYVGTADFMAEHFKFCNHCGAKMEREEISERNMKMWEELFKAERGGKE